MIEDRKNQIASFYLEHYPLISLLTNEQAGMLLKAILACVFEGKDTTFDDHLLNSVYTATKASALRQAKKYLANQSRSEKMDGNQNARKHPVEPAIEVPAPPQQEDVRDLF